MTIDHNNTWYMGLKKSTLNCIVYTNLVDLGLYYIKSNKRHEFLQIDFSNTLCI